MLPVHVLVPCHGPERERWFEVGVASRFDDSGSCAGAVVTLAPVPPPTVATVPAGHGLDTIEHRAVVHGGTAVLSSRPGGGTRLSWTVPVRVEGEAG